MEWESDSPCRSHTHPGEGHGSPGRYSSWELEFRDCGAIPGQGLPMTAEREIEGMWRRLWREIPVEESWAAMEARWYCWATCSGWSHHHSLSPLQAIIGSWMIERMVHQTSDALNYSLGPHPGCFFKWLMCWTTEKDPRQGSSLSAKWAKLHERLAKEVFWSRVTKELKKDSDRAILPAVVHVPAHMAPPRFPQAKQGCLVHAPLSLGQRCNRQEVLHLCAQGCFNQVRLFVTL